MSCNKIELACIIDDDGIYVNLVKRIIETKNLCKRLMIFRDGKESIDYFEEILQNLSKKSIPEIILLDLNMPIMDGWEFLERFIKIKNNFGKLITLYVVSSSINPEDVKRAKAISAVEDYIIKPMKVEDLKDIFNKCA